MNQPGYIICIWEFRVKRKGRVTLSVKTFTLSEYRTFFGHTLKWSDIIQLSIMGIAWGPQAQVLLQRNV